MDRDGEPGTARFGNFINYYSFNPAQKRTSLLPDDLLMSENITDEKEIAHVLDVGCNSGELTTALYEKLQASRSAELKVLGIDLDEHLIQRSQDSNENGDIVFEVADVMKENDRKSVIAPWLSNHGVHEFDLVTCFSITMWIHLHHGDEGLKDFLKYLTSFARFVIIEPQPWKCYRTAKRRMKKLDCDTFEKFAILKWRNNVEQNICDYLSEDCNMRLIKTFGCTDWDRKVCLFAKR